MYAHLKGHTCVQHRSSIKQAQIATQSQKFTKINKC